MYDKETISLHQEAGKDISCRGSLRRSSFPHASPPLPEPATVITGASRGLGCHLARRLAAPGAALALVARSASDLDDAVREAEAAGAQAAAYPLDVTDRAAFAAALSDAAARFDGLDAVVLNAGAGLYSPSTSGRRTRSTRCWT